MRSIKRIGLVLIFALCAALAFAAQDPSVLLEKAIYTEETLGNLNDAIAIYQQVVANADAARVTAAQALFRLGMCYQKSGHKEDAQAAFAKLSKLYPEQRELIAQIPSHKTAPPFVPAPAFENFVLRYSMTTKGTSGMAYQLNIIQPAKKDGKPGWKYRSIMGMTGAMTSTAIWMDSNYAPVYRYTRGPEQGLRSQVHYYPDHIEIVDESGNEPKTTRLPLEQPAYDAEQVIFLLRCLPLHEGFQTTLPILKISDGSIINLSVEVIGRETITVPFGTRDCYKIVTKTRTEERVYWLERESPFRPVKYTAGNSIEMELASVLPIVNSSLPVEEKEFTWALPSGWTMAQSRMLGVKMISLIDPEDLTTCYMSLSPSSQGGAGAVVEDIQSALPKVVDQVISMYQTQYKEFKERDGSRENVSISGSAALRFIADHKALIGGQDMVTYAYFLATDKIVIQLFFKANREDFERMRPVFDSIASSIQLK